jgi:hypothetical protein
MQDVQSCRAAERVRVTLQLADYGHSVCLGAKPLVQVVKVKVMLRPTVRQPVFVSGRICGPSPGISYCLTVAGLMTWGALSYERTTLSFTIAAGLRQRNHIYSRQTL